MERLKFYCKHEEVFFHLCVTWANGKMSDGELFSLHTWTESPIIRSWNHLSVVDQNLVDFHWQNSADTNAWWVLVKPVCFFVEFVIQGAEIMKVGFGKFSGEKSSLILMFKLRRLFDFDKIICQLEKKRQSLGLRTFHGKGKAEFSNWN